MQRCSCIAFALLALPISAAAQTHHPATPRVNPAIHSGPMNETYPGLLLVKMRGLDPGNMPVVEPNADSLNSVTPIPRGDDLNRLATKLQGGQFLTSLPHGGWTLWRTPIIEKPDFAAQALRSDPAVIWAEPVNRVYELGGPPTPNDGDWNTIETDGNFVLDFDGTGQANFRRLWHLWDDNAVTLDSGGVLSGGWSRYPGTWYTAATKPAKAPMIAFVDTGCDMDHPDFINAGGKGTDTTQGGQIVKSLSAYFLNGLPVKGKIPQDINGHGTHVAGIAVAAGNNGSYLGDGVIGIGYNSRAMILRVFDDSDNATDMNAAGAIYYAADHGADIINLSLGTTNYSQVFQDAVTYAWQKGCLIVCAGNESGNGGGNLGPIYPAACSGALAVTANSPGGTPADANYAGSGSYVDIAAPGGDVMIYSETEFAIQYVFSTACRQACHLSEDPNVQPPYTLDYTYLVGTSMACPNVSGAAGLYYGQNGLSQSSGYANLRAYQALERSAAPTNGVSNGGWESTQGYGSLDVDALLNKAVPNPRGASVGTVAGIVYYGGTPLANVRVTATPTKGGQTFQTTTLTDGTYRFDGIPPGIYNVTAAPFGASKTKVAPVTAGADFTGHDFFCGPAISDGSPFIAKFTLLSETATSLVFQQWAYDTVSEIDSATVRAGTTPNGSNIKASTMIVPGSTALTLSGLTLPTEYYVTLNYTNGVGNSTTAVYAHKADGADACVEDGAAAGSDLLNGTISVATGASGTNKVSYLSFDVSNFNKQISYAKLVLTGNAASPVFVGAYSTNATSWTESSLNWNNRPATTTKLGDTKISAGGTYTWNVTSAVQAAKTAGATTVTIALVCDNASTTGATFASHRSTPAPLLQVTSHN